MKKLLLIAGLLFIPSIGFGYTNADDAFNQADAASKAGGKDGWAKVGEIKRDANIISTQLGQMITNSTTALKTPGLTKSQQLGYGVAIGEANKDLGAWKTTITKIDDIINRSKSAFIIGNAQKAVDLKTQVKSGAAGDATVSGDPVWAQL